MQEKNHNGIFLGKGVGLNQEKQEVVVPVKDESLRVIDDWITFEKTAMVVDDDAANSAKYPIFYVPNVRCFLIEARERHTANGSSDASVTIEKLSDGTAQGSGVTMISSPIMIGVNANKTQLRGASMVLAGVQLTPGDAVALRSAGTLTNARDVTVTALFGMHMKDLPSGQSTTVVLSGL